MATGRRRPVAVFEVQIFQHLLLVEWTSKKIDIDTCRHCGGTVKFIAGSEDPKSAGVGRMITQFEAISRPGYFLKTSVSYSREEIS